MTEYRQYNDTHNLERMFRIVRGELRTLANLREGDTVYILTMPDETSLSRLNQHFNDVPSMLQERTGVVQVTFIGKPKRDRICFKLKCNDGRSASKVEGNTKAFPYMYMVNALENSLFYAECTIWLDKAPGPTDTVAVRRGIDSNMLYREGRELLYVRQTVIVATDKAELARAMRTHAMRLHKKSRTKDDKAIKGYIRKTAMMIQSA